MYKSATNVQIVPSVFVIKFLFGGMYTSQNLSSIIYYIKDAC